MYFEATLAAGCCPAAFLLIVLRLIHEEGAPIYGGITTSIDPEPFALCGSPSLCGCSPRTGNTYGEPSLVSTSIGVEQRQFPRICFKFNAIEIVALWRERR